MQASLANERRCVFHGGGAQRDSGDSQDETSVRRLALKNVNEDKTNETFPCFNIRILFKKMQAS